MTSGSTNDAEKYDTIGDWALDPRESNSPELFSIISKTMLGTSVGGGVRQLAESFFVFYVPTLEEFDAGKKYGLMLLKEAMALMREELTLLQQLTAEGTHKARVLVSLEGSALSFHFKRMGITQGAPLAFTLSPRKSIVQEDGEPFPDCNWLSVCKRLSGDIGVEVSCCIPVVGALDRCSRKQTPSSPQTRTYRHNISCSPSSQIGRNHRFLDRKFEYSLLSRL
jgi:hypothetical protein